jgi:hypothetical protein
LIGAFFVVFIILPVVLSLLVVLRVLGVVSGDYHRDAAGMVAALAGGIRVVTVATPLLSP